MGPDASPADALAFKIVRDMFLSPEIGLKPSDVQALAEVHASSRITLLRKSGDGSVVERTGCVYIDTSTLPSSDLSAFLNANGHVQSGGEREALQRSSTMALAALYHASDEQHAAPRDGQQSDPDTDQFFEQKLNSLVKSSGTVYGSSASWKVWSDKEGTKHLYFPSNAKISHPAILHERSVARDNTLQSILPPAFRWGVENYLT